MCPEAQLSDLIAALDMDSEEIQTYFDRRTGRIVSIESSVIGAVEEGRDQELEDLGDWQKDEVEAAQAIVEDNGDRFVPGPDRFDFHEYRQMERFINSLNDAQAADQLWRAIKGRGAFRYFKDTLHRLGIQDDWYQFRDEAAKRFVIEWAEEHNICYVDDTKKAPQKAGGILSPCSMTSNCICP